MEPNHCDICFCAGIEDQDNWHGKALGDKGSPALEALKASITNNTTITPLSPEVSAPAINVSNIQLSEPPSYENGQKVNIITKSTTKG